MKFKVFTEQLYNCFINADYKKQFERRYLTGQRTFETMPVIEITTYDRWTRKQQGSIWGDWQLVADLLYEDVSYIYYQLQKDERLLDCWIIEDGFKPDGSIKYKFVTLSGFTKEHIIDTNFIPRYRDILQERVNTEYGEYVYIKWFKKDNL